MAAKASGPISRRNIQDGAATMWRRHASDKKFKMAATPCDDSMGKTKQTNAQQRNKTNTADRSVDGWQSQPKDAHKSEQ